MRVVVKAWAVATVEAMVVALTAAMPEVEPAIAAMSVVAPAIAEMQVEVRVRVRAAVRETTLSVGWIRRAVHVDRPIVVRRVSVPWGLIVAVAVVAVDRCPALHPVAVVAVAAGVG